MESMKQTRKSMPRMGFVSLRFVVEETDSSIDSMGTGLAPVTVVAKSKADIAISNRHCHIGKDKTMWIAYIHSCTQYEQMARILSG